MSKIFFFFLKVSRLTWILFFILACRNFTMANAIDTTKKQMIAGVVKKDNTRYVTLEKNVVFPAILTGNEDEALLYIEKFARNRRDYIIRTYNRSKKYFPKVTAILKKHNLPQELKVLLPLESAFNANAVSKAGAVGYWQIMDEVAKEYGLTYVAQQKAAHSTPRTSKKNDAKKIAEIAIAAKQIAVKDDRKHFNKSTYAAARYLKDRSRNVDNNLLLMVASYNCGIGKVWAAIKKTGQANASFWDIKNYLPAETQSYVMNFITLNVIFHNYEKFKNNTLQFSSLQIKANPLEGGKTKEIIVSETLD